MGRTISGDSVRCRERHPAPQCRSPLLLTSTIVLIAFTFAIPFLPYAGLFGFVPLPPALLAAVAAIAALYVAATELAKRWFYRPQPS